MSPSSSLLPPWPVRLGGRWAVSWQAYLIGIVLNLPLLILTGGSIGAEPVAVADMPRWVVVALASAAVTALWVVIGDRVLFPRRRSTPVPAAAVIAYHAVPGLLFSGTIIAVGSAIGLPPVASIPEFTVTLVAIGLWFGLTMVLLLDARSRFQAQRNELLDAAVDVEMAQLQEMDVAARLQTLVRTRISTATAPLRSEVDTLVAEVTDSGSMMVPRARWYGLAQAMRESAESSVRPLSHELWDLAAADNPRPKWTQVLRQALFSEIFWIGPTLAIVFIGYLRAATYSIGLAPGIVTTIALTGAVGLLLLVANALIRRLPHLRMPVIAVTFLVCQFVGIAYTVGLSPSRDQTDLGAEIAGSIIGMTISLLAPANVASLNHAREAVLRRLRDTTDSGRARQIAQARQLAEVTQRAARKLHGSLQTRLITAASAIEQATTTGNEQGLLEAMAQVATILDEPLDEEVDESRATLQGHVSEACEAWVGILNVDVLIDPRIRDVTGPPAIAAGQIVEEGLANSYRHGDAATVVVRIDIDPEHSAPALRVSLQDDGLGSTGQSEGLGTALLQRLARGRVLRSNNDVGHLVEVVVDL